MKLSTKPISSPGRTEKFPPPLMRFLRSNVGSRSRGRSRSSPMFVRKKSTAIETQEPSSPKVTCMGQVRVRRSSKQAATRTGESRRREAHGRRCKWIRNALSCRHFSGKIKPKSWSCGPVWCKWVSFFQVGFRRKSQIRENSSKFGSRNEDSEEEEEDEEEEDDEENEREANKVFVRSSSTPPKNALLLTRCRSAPYRSSSLASRFWGSPLRSKETGEEEEEEEHRRTELKNSTIINNKDENKPTSELESIASIPHHQEAIIEPKIEEEKLGLFKELEDSIRERIAKSANTEESKTAGGGEEDELSPTTSRPLILTRCKSEPARTAAKKLDPEMSFWKQTRLGIVDSCSQSIL